MTDDPGFTRSEIEFEFDDDEVKILSSVLLSVDNEITDSMAALRAIGDRSSYGSMLFERKKIRRLRAKIDGTAPAAS